MTERVKLYLRLVARELIDGDDEEALWQRRDGLWERMDQAERDEANRLVIDVFGEWYDPADPGPKSTAGEDNPNVTEDGNGTDATDRAAAAGGAAAGG